MFIKKNWDKFYSLVQYDFDLKNFHDQDFDSRKENSFHSQFFKNYCYLVSKIGKSDKSCTSHFKLKAKHYFSKKLKIWKTLLFLIISGWALFWVVLYYFVVQTLLRYIFHNPRARSQINPDFHGKQIQYEKYKIIF